MRIAPALGRLAAGEVVGVHVGQHGDLHVEQRHVDVLAFARAVPVRERGEHGHGGVHAGHQIRDGHAGLLRTAAGQVVALAGQAHEAAHALHDEVIAGAGGVRTGLAEARDGAVDEVWLHGLDRCVVEPVFRELADLVVLEHHIGVRGELADDVLALGRADVDRDRALVAVGGQVVGGLGGVLAGFVLEPRRAPGARVVAGAGTLHFDDVGAKIGKVLRAPGAGKYAGQVENTEMAQSAHGLTNRHDWNGCTLHHAPGYPQPHATNGR